MAAGRPIIVSADAEANRIVSDSEAGICAPAEDARGLADGIHRVAGNAERRVEMGRAARATARFRFDRTVTVRQTADCLLRAAASHWPART